MPSLNRTTTTIDSGIEQGLHFGAQLYISLDGSVVADESIGHRTPDPDSDPITADQWPLWLSASKPAAALAVAQLWERGKLDLDAPVAETIPEFAQNGKGPITTRHLLTHTAGFPNVDLGLYQPDWHAAIAKVCATPLENGWIVGKTAGYHYQSSWYVLGELLRRIDGRPFDRYVREAIFEPLGMTQSWIGMPRAVYDANESRILPVFNTFRRRVQEIPVHTREAVTSCLPAGNGRGPIRELAWFYEALLNGGERNGDRILNPETVAEFTRTHRIGAHDRTFNTIMDWGLGFMVNSARHGAPVLPYGFGAHGSPTCYGHGGRQSVAAFTDPEHRLVIALWFNGLPGEPRHTRRNHDVLTAIYEDLSLP